MQLTAIPKHTPHSWADIERLPIQDNQEPLLPVPNGDKLKQQAIYHDHGVPHAIDVCVARQGVISKLQAAAALLPEELGLVVLDAWRSREVQQALQDQVGAEVRATYPHLSPEAQQALLLQFVAPVGPHFVSPHLTGGSVDVTLFERATGRLLDMGSAFDEPSERSHTVHYENQPTHPAHHNRRLLYCIMTAVGFSNLPTEWWHFDHGNPLWAYYTQQECAIYGASHWPNNRP